MLAWTEKVTDMDKIVWVHTVPCKFCQGRNAHYARRPGCRGCPSLLEHIAPRQPVKRDKPKAAPSMADKVLALHAQGKRYKEIAEALRISENTVCSYVYKANKAAGTNRQYRRADK